MTKVDLNHDHDHDHDHDHRPTTDPPLLVLGPAGTWDLELYLPHRFPELKPESSILQDVLVI